MKTKTDKNMLTVRQTSYNSNNDTVLFENRQLFYFPSNSNTKYFVWDSNKKEWTAEDVTSKEEEKTVEQTKPGFCNKCNAEVKERQMFSGTFIGCLC